MNPVLKAAILVLGFLVVPLVSLLGSFGRELYLALIPVARLGGFIYLGVCFRQGVEEFGRSALALATLVFAGYLGVLFVSGSIGDWYVLPVKLLANIEEGSVAERYAEAHKVVDKYLQDQVGQTGVVGHLLLSAQRSMTKEGLGSAVASQFEDIDSLGGLIAALVNVVLILIPWGLVWLIGVASDFSPNPAYVYLIWWSAFSLGLFGLGYWIEKSE